MAYIAPSSIVWVIQNCPLDNTYEHTIWFYNERGQADYFRTLRKYLLENQTYQRVGRDRIRVEIPYSGLYDCNYLMFKNAAYESKCFYAFITDIEYVNNSVCEITYELDVMQTWMFDYDLQPCFVEREHAMTDAIGDNILPEPVGLGEYVYNTGPYKLIADNFRNAVIVAIVDVSESGSSGGDSGGGDSGGGDSGGGSGGGDSGGGGSSGTDVVLDITGPTHANLYHSDVDGSGVEHIGAVTTELIDISSYSSFTVTRTASSVYNCFYDASNHYIQDSSFATGIGDTVVGGPDSFIPIPSTAKYVIISNDVADNISVTVTIRGEDILGDPVSDTVDALTDGPGVNGHVYDGIYGAATLYAFQADDVASINAKINEYKQKPEAVIGVYTCNTLAIDTLRIPEGGILLEEDTFGKTYNLYLGPALTASSTIDGYAPRNRKLLTYPYNLMHIDNLEGESLDLRYEFCEDYLPQVRTIASITQPVEVILHPTHYKNSGNAMDVTQSIKVANFPLCSWAVDAYQAWIAQNAVPTLIHTAGGLVRAGIAGLAFGVPAAVGSIAGTVADTVSDFYTASIQADITRGSASSGSATFGHRMKDFFYARMSITAQHARMIDEFFDRYGYATNRVKQPNISGRPQWNYVKTKGAIITGKVPTPDANKICSIYDHGITFWKSGNRIGNYSLDNSIS